MRTAEECLAKAAALTKLADECPIAEVRQQIIETAESWRALAVLAAWQDGQRRNLN